LRIEGSPLDIRATLHGKYSAGEFALGPDEPATPDSVRDLDAERAAFDRVREGPLRWNAETQCFTAVDDEAARVWCAQIPSLRAGGEPSIRVSIAEGLEGALVRRSVKSKAKVSFKQDWFELDARFSADDVSIDRAMIRAALAARRRWIALDDGTLAEITDVVRESGVELLELLGPSGPTKLSRFSLGRVDRLADGADVTLDEAASRGARAAARGLGRALAQGRAGASVHAAAVPRSGARVAAVCRRASVRRRARGRHGPGQDADDHRVAAREEATSR
jgi:hypothetical protein